MENRCVYDLETDERCLKCGQRIELRMEWWMGISWCLFFFYFFFWKTRINTWECVQLEAKIQQWLVNLLEAVENFGRRVKTGGHCPRPFHRRGRAKNRSRWLPRVEWVKRFSDAASMHCRWKNPANKYMIYDFDDILLTKTWFWSLEIDMRSQMDFQLDFIIDRKCDCGWDLEGKSHFSVLRSHLRKRDNISFVRFLIEVFEVRWSSHSSHRSNGMD